MTEYYGVFERDWAQWQWWQNISVADELYVRSDLVVLLSRCEGSSQGWIFCLMFVRAQGFCRVNLNPSCCMWAAFLCFWCFWLNWNMIPDTVCSLLKAKNLLLRRQLLYNHYFSLIWSSGSRSYCWSLKIKSGPSTTGNNFRVLPNSGHNMEGVNCGRNTITLLKKY